MVANTACRVGAPATLFQQYTEPPTSSLKVPDCVLVGVIQHDLVSQLDLLLDQAVSQLNTLGLLAAPFLMQCKGL